MTKPLAALPLLALSLAFGCSSEEEAPDPLAQPEGFCQAWGEAACQANVVLDCDAASADDCIDAQSGFCLSILPDDYSSKRAKQCLSEVQRAYEDVRLSAEELQVVRYLAEPCHQLSAGSREQGDTCSNHEQCNNADGVFCVIKPGSTFGRCVTPEEVPPGDPCDGDAQVCTEGYYCNGENCVRNRAVDASCESDYECVAEARCVVTVDEEGVEAGACTERLPVNELCAADAECQSHYCLIPADATEGECASTIRLSRSEPLCDDLR
jgi:hypothetical protein